MHYQYQPQGVCSRLIDLEIEDGIIVDAQFLGGCNGNTQGVCALVKGMRADEVIKRLEGIDCKGKRTSCPDQLSKALKAILAQEG